MHLSREQQGLLFCLASAAGFAAMAIFAKYAYAEGLNVVTLLGVRFAIAATVLWLLARARGAIGSGRALVLGAAIGFAGYACESGLFFASLERIDASLAALIIYIWPALVMIGAFALGREALDRRRVVALTAALAGVALVLAAGDIGSVDGLGLLFALGAAVGYAGYVLGSDHVAAGTTPLAFAAAVCTGAANAFILAGVVTGSLDLSISAAGWGWIVALALVSTVFAITAFLEGMQRIGPSRAGIVSTVEPPITVALAALLFAESLTALQLAGGALVLSAVVLLRVGGSSDGAPAAAPAPAAVGAAGEDAAHGRVRVRAQVGRLPLHRVRRR